VAIIAHKAQILRTFCLQFNCCI